jgi:hypothetical protein
VGKRLIRPTEEFTTDLPFSEVCLHLRVAGTRMRARLEPNQMVQLLHPDGSQFSFPITAAEAGLHLDSHGAWLTTLDHEPTWPAADLPADTAVADQEQSRVLLEALSQPLDVGDRHRWRGEVIDGPGGPLSWHPELGYVSIPDARGEEP